MNKKQVQILFDHKAVLWGTNDGVPLDCAAVLLGEDAASHASHREGGVYWNAYGVGDYTLSYLTLRGFQAAISFYNVQRLLTGTGADQSGIGLEKAGAEHE